MNGNSSYRSNRDEYMRDAERGVRTEDERRNINQKKEEDRRNPLEKFFGIGAGRGENRREKKSQQRESVGREVRERDVEPPRGLQIHFPQFTIAQTPEEIRITAQVDGVDANNINIEVAEDWMAVSGWVEHVVVDETQPENYDRSLSAFRREFILPSEVREEDVEATYENGRLTVIAPKASRMSQSRVRIDRSSR